LFITGIYLQLLPKKPKAHDLYYSPTIIWLIKTIIMTYVGHVARIGDRRVAHRDMVQKTKGERTLGRTSRRWRHNVKMVLQRVWLGHGLDLSGSGSG